MGEVPWLVVYGHFVWPSILLIVAVSVGVATWRRGRGRGRAVGFGLGAALLGALLLWGVGHFAISRARVTHHTLGGHGFDGPRVAYDLGNRDWLAIAAAMPGSRGDALDELDGRFQAYYVRDTALLARWQRLARLRGGCGGELGWLREHERVVELAASVDQCDDAAEVSASRLYLGDYARAASDPQLVDAQIGAHAWGNVASIAKQFRERLARGEPALYLQLYPTAVAEVSPRLLCAELYFRGRAGDRTAVAELHQGVGGDPFCKVFDALSLPPDRQADALAAAYEVAPDGVARQTIESLLWVVGAPLPDHDHGFEDGLDLFGMVAVTTIDTEFVRNAVLARFASATRNDPDGSRAHAVTNAWQADLALLRGDVATARSLAAIAARNERFADDMSSFVLALAVRSGAPIARSEGDGFRLHPSLLHAVVVGRGELFKGTAGSLPFDAPDCDPDVVASAHAALQQAIDGDGVALAAIFARCGLRASRGMETVMAVMPRVRRGRDELAELLRASAADLFAETTPFDVIRRALLRRDLSRVIGDAETAGAWQAVIDRHLAVLADRETALAVVLWHLL